MTSSISSASAGGFSTPQPLSDPKNTSSTFDPPQTSKPSMAISLLLTTCSPKLSIVEIRQEAAKSQSFASLKAKRLFVSKAATRTEGWAPAQATATKISRKRLFASDHQAAVQSEDSPANDRPQKRRRGDLDTAEVPTENLQALTLDQPKVSASTASSASSNSAV